MKRQPTEWEKIIICQVIYQIRDLYSKYIYNPYKSTANNPIKRWAGDINRHFPKGDTEITNRDMKRCATSLIMRDVQIKTTRRHHLTPVRRATVNDSANRCRPGCALLLGMQTGAATGESSSSSGY